ncbi:hypothetical protein DPMN_106138 [Dreissena polymorpha]|uniref:Uncharacterized protein n=1 Tax=Dreissena polymorpha TaxID=45954 RepID=A0A9D4K4L6_DREPO|nr:hypothetical protein DPMN_106138 [Dreissena polymorpha]
MQVMTDVGTEPTCFESESSDAEDLERDDEMIDAYIAKAPVKADDADDDPDWEPEDDSDEEYASEDEENIWKVFLKTAISRDIHLTSIDLHIASGGQSLEKDTSTPF